MYECDCLMCRSIRNFPSGKPEAPSDNVAAVLELKNEALRKVLDYFGASSRALVKICSEALSVQYNILSSHSKVSGAPEKDFGETDADVNADDPLMTDLPPTQNNFLWLRDCYWRIKCHHDTMKSALIRLRDCDWVITPHDRMDAVRQIAREALEATSVGAGGNSPAVSVSASPDSVSSQESAPLSKNNLRGDESESPKSEAIQPRSSPSHSLAPLSECKITGASSRMCERGTKSCEVRHSETPASSQGRWRVLGGQLGINLWTLVNEKGKVLLQSQDQALPNRIRDAHNASLKDDKRGNAVPEPGDVVP